MSYAHVTIATQDVSRTAEFLEQALGYTRAPRPANSPAETIWLDVGDGQQLHIVYVEGFAVSPFEGEFGRHVAVRHDATMFDALKATLQAMGAEVFLPLRPSAVVRFFFREPVNGYVFEVVDRDAGPLLLPVPPL